MRGAKKKGWSRACRSSCSMTQPDFSTGAASNLLGFATIQTGGGLMTNLSAVLKSLKKERDLVERRLSGLNAAIAAFVGVYGGAAKRRSRRTLSASGRKRIAAAQRARWAKVRGQTKTGRRTMSASARRKIAAAQRARWAKLLGATGKTQVSGDVRGSAHHKIRRS